MTNFGKWKLSMIIALITTFVIAAPALAKWSDQSLLSSMASFNIFELTRNLSELTGEMLRDTEQLETEVGKASGTLDALDKQDELLAAQIETNRSIHHELSKQLAGNIKARELMKEILSREENTFTLTQQVAAQANDISGQMGTTVRQLGNVAASTGQVGANTKKLNGQMDQLLVQLDQSVDNFRFIARITDALSYLEDKTGIDLPIPRQPDSKQKKETILPIPDKPEDILSPLIPGSKKDGNGQEKEQDENDNGGGLLDILLP
ncbi:hypothetical protein [Lihuaxuella thermophila]|uniref:Uncharacterized protein n=1 Tax=Lihuaxuella thermophila TaxID=1173111 RepID=A0A1H8FC18_9BACL|nr:hypothetical protein [Lihuaxuella thermophila]SEN29126.1 hypothetical protein SAMN05444955_108116 [Lihuaxuella thermophila]